MQHTSCDPSAASVSAHRKRPCCAWPFGAVRLALRPSCRTPLPHTEKTPATSVAVGCRSDEHIDSPRKYPSARASNVWQCPNAEVMPALANVTPTPGSNITLTAHTKPWVHSASCNARNAAWVAASADEHAVSYEAQGPCRPSTNDSRPAAMESALPVAA